MTTVNISLPDDVKTMAEAEALKAGQSLEEYLANLIIAHSDQPVSPEVEADLLRGLESPGREFSAATWEAKKRRHDVRQSRTQ